MVQDFKYYELFEKINNFKFPSENSYDYVIKNMFSLYGDNYENKFNNLYENYCNNSNILENYKQNILKEFNNFKIKQLNNLGNSVKPVINYENGVYLRFSLKQYSYIINLIGVNGYKTVNELFNKKQIPQILRNKNFEEFVFGDIYNKINTKYLEHYRVIEKGLGVYRKKVYCVNASGVTFRFKHKKELNEFYKGISAYISQILIKLRLLSSFNMNYEKFVIDNKYNINGNFKIKTIISENSEKKDIICENKKLYWYYYKKCILDIRLNKNDMYLDDGMIVDEEYKGNIFQRLKDLLK